MGQCVGHGVKTARPILDGEVEAEELADPLVLRYGRQPLIQEELQAVVVRANVEGPSPQVWPPMTNGLHKANELPLVCRQLKMAWSERPAEESEGPIALMKHGAEPGARGVTVHHERAVEVGHLEDGARREGPLEGLERRRRPRRKRRGEATA